MKKSICIILILVCLFSFNLYSLTSVLIDFSRLKANGDGNPANSVDINSLKYDDHSDKRMENMPTIVDYAEIANEIGSNFSEDQLKNVSVSLSCYNWDVFLNSSAAFPKNTAYSYAREWHTKAKDIPILEPIVKTEGEAAAAEGYSILGVRIKFPETPYNCWALILPPFEIPAYENITTDDKGNKIDENELKANKEKYYGNKFERGYGVVKNVGVIKSIDLRVYGCQFKNSISILLKDDNNVVTEYCFPQYLDFDGWRRLTWNNPNYITRAENRDLYVVPLYPRNEPFVKVWGFRIYRQGDQLGGDFVVYIKDVIITYDEAVKEREEPIDHESAWGILQERTIEAKHRELRKIGHTQMLRYLERQKMHKEPESTTTTQ